jgi:hypothetical protein
MNSVTMNSVKGNGQHYFYHLRRQRDGFGCKGPLSLLLPDEFFEVQIDKSDSRPKVGYRLAVGYRHGPFLSRVRLVVTTRIIDILLDSPDYMLFRTMNSIYEWKVECSSHVRNFDSNDTKRKRVRWHITL